MSGYDAKAVKATYDLYVKQGAAAATALSNKNFSKLCKDCKIVNGKTITNADVDITFSKHKTKGQQNITFDQFIAVMKEFGAKKNKSNPDEIFKLIVDKAPQAAGTTKTSKTGGVDKMTDASQYTGSHKERFGADGKGLGMAGREDMVENTGYVGAYKEAGTYDKK